MQVKSLIIADGMDPFVNVTIEEPEIDKQKMFPDFKLIKVIEQDGTVTYVNSLFISSIIFYGNEIKKER